MGLVSDFGGYTVSLGLQRPPGAWIHALLGRHPWVFNKEPCIFLLLQTPPITELVPGDYKNGSESLLWEQHTSGSRAGTGTQAVWVQNPGSGSASHCPLVRSG